MTFSEIWSAIWSPLATFNKAFNANETFRNLDGHRYYTWRAIRRQNIDNLTRDIFYIVWYLVFGAATGSDQHHLRPDRVAATQHVAEELGYYGIVYNCGIYAWWAFALLVSFVVTILWFPFQLLGDSSPNRRTIKTITDKHGISHTYTEETATGVMYYIELCNKYTYTCLAFVRLGMFIDHLRQTFRQTIPEPVIPSAETSYPTDRRKVRKVRAGLAGGILASIFLGTGMMYFWSKVDDIELVHVKYYEYAVIIIPIQILIGIVLASSFEAWYERDRPSSTKFDDFDRDTDGMLTSEGVVQAATLMKYITADIKALSNAKSGSKDEGKVVDKQQEVKKEAIHHEEKKKKIDEADGESSGYTSEEFHVVNRKVAEV